MSPVSPTSFVCRVCGETGGHQTYTVREMMFGRRDPFVYIGCRECGCNQISEIPNNLSSYYGREYYSFDNNLDAEFDDLTVRRQRARRVRALVNWPKFLASRVKHADMRRPLWSLRRLRSRFRDRILDVGCGSGRLLYQLRNAGWSELLGVDAYLDEDRRYANGLTIKRAELGDVEGTWNVIMFHHVFEHVPEPCTTLAQVAARLAPNGTCLIRIPLADSEAFARYGSDWVQLDAPRHLHLHTRRSLEIAAARAGLRVAAVDFDSYELQFWGSEQYRRGIPLQSPQSYRWGQGPAVFSAREIRDWQDESRRLNRTRRGDQACFYLRHAKA